MTLVREALEFWVQFWAAYHVCTAVPNNASTNLGSSSLVLEAIRTLLTALRFPKVPLRSKSGSCPATRRFLLGYGAKRLPDGQRDDTLPSNGRLPLAESGFSPSRSEPGRAPALVQCPRKCPTLFKEQLFITANKPHFFITILT